VIGSDAFDELRALAAPLRGARVLQINATPYGGGVSELLRSLVPLERDLGLVADWKIISGDDAFFEVTKRLHNGLQGARGPVASRPRSVSCGQSGQRAAARRRE
jgi:trehalose synthase